MRFKGLKGLFTYHDFSPTSILSKEIIFDQLVSIFDSLDFEIYKYYLVREEKENPHIIIPYFEEKLKEKSSSQHFHIYFEIKDNDVSIPEKGLDLKNPLFLDFFVEETNKRIHGNYLAVTQFLNSQTVSKCLPFDFDNLKKNSKEILKSFNKNYYLGGGLKTILYLLKEDRYPSTNLEEKIIFLLDDLRSSFELDGTDRQLIPLQIKNILEIPVIKESSLIETETENMLTRVEYLKSAVDSNKNINLKEDYELLLETSLTIFPKLESISDLESFFSLEKNLVSVFLTNSFLSSSLDLEKEIDNFSPIVEKITIKDLDEDFSCILKDQKRKKSETKLIFYMLCYDLQYGNVEKLFPYLLSIVKIFRDSFFQKKNCKVGFFLDISTYSYCNEKEKVNFLNFLTIMKKIYSQSNIEKIDNKVLLLLKTFDFSSSNNNITININTINSNNNCIITNDLSTSAFNSKLEKLTTHIEYLDSKLEKATNNIQYLQERNTFLLSKLEMHGLILQNQRSFLETVDKNTHFLKENLEILFAEEVDKFEEKK